MTDKRKTVLITGCSGPGIGAHLATQFNDRGFRVFATARKAESLSRLSEKGIEALSLTVDDPESIKACFAEVEKRVGGGGLDFIVNNAGRNYTVPASELDLPEIQALFATNLFAPMMINQTFLPLLLAARGTVVHIGSVAALTPMIWGSTYNASKAALHSYGDTLRTELAPFGVHVVNVITGGVKSNITRTTRSLKPGSLWEGFEEQYAQRQVYSQRVGVDTRQYAKTVVSQLVTCRGHLWDRNEIWAGSSIMLVTVGNYLDRWVPGGIWRFLIPFLGHTWGAGKRKDKNA
ncbi:MAG: hypothetical protein LQ340_007562 [Diploschistes diacapsis]|nr:MAG: hypothetical protein LQ340_007562 [Diploschistes diacapsis]